MSLLLLFGQAASDGKLHCTGVGIHVAGATPHLRGTGTLHCAGVGVSVANTTSYLFIKPQGASSTVTITIGDYAPRLRAFEAASTMSATVRLRIGHRYLRLHVAGESLPPTDDIGWILPDVTPPDILGMRFKVGGVRVPNARVVSCPMVLSDRGGFESATLSVRLKDMWEYDFAWHSNLSVTYQDATLFYGRLEESSIELGDELVRVMVFTGPIVRLDDHQSFRRVYVDHDLDNWKTDQGPQTQSRVFEVSA